MSNIKIDDQWKTPTTVYVKVGGAWKIAAQTYSKIDGVWEETTLNSPPPNTILEYHSTGKFKIRNYDSSLIYETSRITGSGSAILDAVTGIFTLTSTNARFSVTSSYAPGSPQSDLQFMERKSYTESTETFQYDSTCSGTRTVSYDCSYDTTENFYCCGDPCVPRISGGQVIAWDCPPTGGWFCQINYQCCTYLCVRTVTVPQTCEREESYTYSCTLTGTRQVRDPIPPNFFDSGTEWYSLI